MRDAREALDAYMAHESDEDAAEFGRRVDAVEAAARTAAWNALLDQLRARHGDCCYHCTAVLRDAAALVRMGVEKGATIPPVAALAAAGQAPAPDLSGYDVRCPQCGALLGQFVKNQSKVAALAAAHTCPGIEQVRAAGQAPAPQPETLSIVYPPSPGSGMVCEVCTASVGWVDCPTGGWWAHGFGHHPADGHDAAPRPAPQPETAPDAEAPRRPNPFDAWARATDRLAAERARVHPEPCDYWVTQDCTCPGAPPMRRRSCRITRPHPHHAGCPGISTAEHYATHPPKGTIRLPEAPEADRD